MGLLNGRDAKANALAEDARRAATEGRAVFAAHLPSPLTHTNSPTSISGWAEMIEAIEGEGWTLAHWSSATDKADRPIGLPLFRRTT